MPYVARCIAGERIHISLFTSESHTTHNLRLCVVMYGNRRRLCVVMYGNRPGLNGGLTCWGVGPIGSDDRYITEGRVAWACDECAWGGMALLTEAPPAADWFERRMYSSTSLTALSPSTISLTRSESCHACRKYTCHLAISAGQAQHSRGEPGREDGEERAVQWARL
jgi:hypothetical protein